MVIETVTYGQIAKVAIIGSGVMGAGIAETMAAGGIDVLLFDQMADKASAAKLALSHRLQSRVERGQARGRSSGTDIGTDCAGTATGRDRFS